MTLACPFPPRARAAVQTTRPSPPHRASEKSPSLASGTRRDGQKKGEWGGKGGLGGREEDLGVLIRQCDGLMRSSFLDSSAARLA